MLNFEAILEVLARHRVDFVLVGGVAAVLHGVPGTTFDLDIVQSRDPANIDRLLSALRELDAIYRIQPSRRLVPNASHLTSGGHNLLLTKFGPLDVLGTIGHGHAWNELIEHCNSLPLDNGLTIAVLNLPMQITVKEEVAGEKDNIMLPLLRRTLEETNRQS